MPIGSLSVTGVLILTWSGWMDRPLNRLGLSRAGALKLAAAVLLFHMVARQVIWVEWLLVGLSAAALFWRAPEMPLPDTVRLGWLPLSVGMALLWQPLLVSGCDPMWAVPVGAGLISGLVGRTADGALRLSGLALFGTWLLAVCVLDQPLGADDLFQWCFGGWTTAWAADAVVNWTHGRLQALRLGEG